MILIFGDPHGGFKHVLPTVQKEKPAAIIFLGDMGLSRPFEQEMKEVMTLTEVWWIHGNHDTDSTENYTNLYDSAIADRNLHCRVVEIDGLRVAGLGGVFRESIWYPQLNTNAEPHYQNYDDAIESIQRAEKFKALQKLKNGGKNAADDSSNAKNNGEELRHKSSIFYGDWLKLYAERADVLITHEAPSCHPYGFVAIDELAQGLGVKRSFHGHHHDCLDYSSHNEKLGFKAYGVGLRGISDVDGNSILAGKQDHLRMTRQERMYVE